MHADARHTLHTSLQQALGPEPAVILMDALDACATKEDLRTLKRELVHELDLRFGVVDEQFRTVAEQFRSVDERFKGIDERLSRVEDLLFAMSGRLDGLPIELSAWTRTVVWQVGTLMMVFMGGTGLLQLLASR